MQRINSASSSFLSPQSNTGNVIPDLHHTKVEWNGIVWAKILTEWQFPLTTCKYWSKIKLLLPFHCVEIFRRRLLCFVVSREHKTIKSWNEDFQSSESVWKWSSLRLEMSSTMTWLVILELFSFLEERNAVALDSLHFGKQMDED